MNEMMFVVILVIVVCAMVLGLILSAKARRARMEQMAALAARNGWSFTADPLEGDSGLFSPSSGRCALQPFERFSFFQDGYDRQFRNVMEGELPGASEGGPRLVCEAGDFSWSTGSGKNRQTHRRSYLLFNVTHDLGILPDLGIRPEDWTDRLIGVFGGGDIDFESEEFSRRFHVTSSDRRFAFAVIDPRMMEFLMSTRPQVVEMRAGWGLVVSGWEQWEPHSFEWAAWWVREFMEHWPAYLVKQCREQGW